VYGDEERAQSGGVQRARVTQGPRERTAALGGFQTCQVDVQ
jgi:hypothetical protein